MKTFFARLARINRAALIGIAATVAVAATALIAAPSLASAPPFASNPNSLTATTGILGQADPEGPPGNTVTSQTVMVCANPTLIHTGDVIAVHVIDTNGAEGVIGSDAWLAANHSTNPNEVATIASGGWLNAWGTSIQRFMLSFSNEAVAPTLTVTSDELSDGLAYMYSTLVPWDIHYSGPGIADISLFNTTTSTEVSAKCAPVNPITTPVADFQTRYVSSDGVTKDVTATFTKASSTPQFNGAPSYDCYLKDVTTNSWVMNTQVSPPVPTTSFASSTGVGNNMSCSFGWMQYYTMQYDHEYAVVVATKINYGNVNGRYVMGFPETKVYSALSNTTKIAPLPPRDVSAVFSSTSAVTISFTAPANQTHFVAKIYSDFGRTTQVGADITCDAPSSSSSTQTVTCPVTGRSFTANTPYFFRVSTVGNAGTTTDQGGAQAQYDYLAPVAKPTISPITSSNSLQFTFTKPSGGLPYDNYDYRYQVQDANGTLIADSNSMNYINCQASSTVTCTVNGGNLPNANFSSPTQYKVRVKATKNFNLTSDWSEWSDLVTGYAAPVHNAPSAVTNITLSFASSSSATVTFTAATLTGSADGIDYYVDIVNSGNSSSIVMGANPYTPTTCTTSGSTLTCNMSVMGATSPTTYIAKVKSVNRWGGNTAPYVTTAQGSAVTGPVSNNGGGGGGGGGMCPPNCGGGGGVCPPTCGGGGGGIIPTPQKPTITAITSSLMTVTFPVRQAETSNSYFARAYLSTDTQFATQLAQSMMPCGPVSPGSLTYTCSIMSMMTGFNSPNRYVATIVAQDTGMNISYGTPSPASDAVTGAIPGVTLTSTPSGGAGNGEAKIVTTAIPWITDRYGSTMSVSGTSAVPFIDGLGSMYTFVDVGATGSTRNYELKKFKSDFTGFESSFGSSGKVSTSFSGSPDTMLPSVSVFGNGTKAALVASVPSCPAPVLGQQNNCNTAPVLKFSEATLGQSFSTPADITNKVTSFCTANKDAALGDITDVTVTNFDGLTALGRPAVMVVCTSRNNQTYVSTTQQFVATVGAGPTYNLSLLFKMFAVNANQNGMMNYSASSNPSATGTAVAGLVYIVRAKTVQSQGYGTAYINLDRVIERVKADGTVVETTNAFTPPTPNVEPTIRLAGVNDGTTVYATFNDSGTLKLVTVPLASGTFEAPTTVTLDSPTPQGSTTSLSFGITAPSVNGTLALVRRDMSMNGGSSTIAPLRFTPASGSNPAVTVSGEALSYTLAGSPVSFSFVDGSGNLDFIYTPAPTQGGSAATTHNLIKWLNVRAMTPQPIPAVTSPVATFSVNAGGTSVNIGGAFLAETSNAKKVTGVKFVIGGGTGTTVVPSAKAANSLTVAIPSATLAATGVVSPATPSPQAPVTAQVLVVLGNGSTLNAGTVKYIGATKLAQPVTIAVANTGVNIQALTTDADRTVTITPGSVVPAQASVAGDFVLSTTTPSVCVISVDNKVDLISNGTCTVKASKPGNDWLLAGEDSKTFSVLKGDVIAADFADGDGPNASATVDGAYIPAVTVDSGLDYTMVSQTPDVCAITDDAALWIKRGQPQNNVKPTCTIRITTPGSSAYAPASFDWTFETLPAVGTADSPLLVRNDGVLVGLATTSVSWKQSTSAVNLTLRTKYVGLFKARMTFTADGTDYTCYSNFGSKAAVPAAQVKTVKAFKSGNFCSDTAGRTPAEKAAQALALTKFQALVATHTAVPLDTLVRFSYQFEKHYANSGALYPGQKLLTAGDKEWTADSFANLHYRAIDKVKGSLPVGVPAAVSATEAGAIVPVIAVESKRTNYTLASANAANCAVLADKRIWVKTAGQTCSITVHFDGDATWDALNKTFSFQTVAAVADSANNAAIAPSNGTAVNVGPLSLTWTQSTSAVKVSLTGINVGLASAKITFTDSANPPVSHTCTLNFGSAARVTTGLGDPKIQASATFCSGADLNAFKALVTARKSGPGQGVIPITVAYKFEQHDPSTGTIIGSTLANLAWSSDFFVKLNFRASTN